MPAQPTPLKFLAPNWFAMVMGLSGLALAWLRAEPLMGEAAGAGAMALGILAAAVALVLAAASLQRWRRYPQALADDLRHPVRHAFVATLPVSLILLATVLTAMAGPSIAARALWMTGAAWQFGITVWALSRWLAPSAGAKEAAFWPSVTPALFIPVVGNVLVPLAGVPLGLPAWSAAQFGVGLLLWPVLLTLLAVRIGVQGLWPERLLPVTFITVAPPAVIGLALLQLGAGPVLAWGAWGLALFFLLWSSQVARRAVAQPFSMAFWAVSFPLAAFASLTLRLADGGPAGFGALAMVALALASIVVAALVLGTVRGLRDGTLLAPEPVALLQAAP